MRVDAYAGERFRDRGKITFGFLFGTIRRFPVLDLAPWTPKGSDSPPHREDVNAYCSDRTPDGGDPAQALWGNRARRVVAHGRIDRTRPRSNALRQRRFNHLGAARIRVAACNRAPVVRP